MTYTEFDQYITQKLTALADTEHNQKKHKTLSELEDIMKQIKDKNADLQNAIAGNQYDQAVAIKEDISRLTVKSSIIREVFSELNKVSEYNDDDLKALSDELVNFYDQVRNKILEDRTDIIAALDGNYHLMEEAFEAYKNTKLSINEKAARSDYDHGKIFWIPSKDDSRLMDEDGIKKILDR